MESLAMAKALAVLLVSILMMPLAVVAAQQPGESRETPIPAGQTGQVGEFEVRVVDVIPDATDVVLALPAFNVPPELGHVFFMVRIEVTYTGQDIGSPWYNMSYDVIGDKNRVYSDVDHSCGFVPDDPQLVPDLFPGGSVEFNICWSIPEEEVDSLLMYAGPLYFFSLRPEERL